MLRGSDPRDAAPWLAAIARNECRARLRKRSRAPVALDGEVESQLTDPTDLTEIADRRSEIAEVTAAMAELPIRQREAIALRDFLGLSYEEVASTLSVSVPVVESLLFRARRRLRDTVRTVPRYAAGIVVVPIAMKAALSRDIPEVEASGGLISGAAAAVAAGLAKLISIPFASKAATAVAIAAASTAVPPLIQHPATPPPPPVAAAAAEPSADAELQTRPAASAAAQADAEPADKAAAKGAPADEAEAPAEAPPPAAETPQSDPAPPENDGRIAAATTEGPELELPPAATNEELLPPCDVSATDGVEPTTTGEESTEGAGDQPEPGAEPAGEPEAGAETPPACAAPGTEEPAPSETGDGEESPVPGSETPPAEQGEEPPAEPGAETPAACPAPETADAPASTSEETSPAGDCSAPAA
jgi:RNA polymerase sigma factor (sigma-70 family)